MGESDAEREQAVEAIVDCIGDDSIEERENAREYVAALLDGPDAPLRLASQVRGLEERLRAVTDELAAWHAECDAVGVPHHPAGLVRHWQGNSELVGATRSLVCVKQMTNELERLIEWGDFGLAELRHVIALGDYRTNWPDAAALSPVPVEQDTGTPTSQKSGTGSAEAGR